MTAFLFRTKKGAERKMTGTREVGKEKDGRKKKEKDQKDDGRGKTLRISPLRNNHALRPPSPPLPDSRPVTCRLTPLSSRHGAPVTGPVHHRGGQTVRSAGSISHSVRHPQETTSYYREGTSHDHPDKPLHRLNHEPVDQPRNHTRNSRDQTHAKLPPIGPTAGPGTDGTPGHRQPSDSKGEKQTRDLTISYHAVARRVGMRAARDSNPPHRFPSLHSLHPGQSSPRPSCHARARTRVCIYADSGRRRCHRPSFLLRLRGETRRLRTTAQVKQEQQSLDATVSTL